MTMQVRLQVVCHHPPTTDSSLFGLQDKDQNLHAGILQTDGSVLFECVLNVKEVDPPNLLGAFAHGTPKERFLYLSLGTPPLWIKRIKLMLSSITPAQMNSGRTLRAEVDGQRAASVRVNWTLI